MASSATKVGVNESYEHSSQNKSSSGSVGLSFTGAGVSATASASRAKGQADGESQSSTNTRLQAGGTLTFNSGGDTTLQGATASGNKVTGTVGGDLILTSLQDTNTYSEKQSSTGVGVSLCIPPISAGASSVNVSVSKTNINSNHQSVGEQTAIRAGDGGFDIDVKGKTTLTGAQITSTDKAVQGGKNSFKSAGGIDMQDLQNSAQYDADSFSVSATVRGDSRNEDGTPKLDTAGKPIQGKPEGSFGFGSDSGQGSSTSTSGISGIAGDTSARTGDEETGLKPLFDAAKTKAEVQSQVAITAEFGKNASKAWGDYANTKFLDAVKSGDEDEAKCWAPDGTCRAAGHVFIGGLTGGAAGAAGAGASSLAAPHLQAFLVDAGLSPTAASAITQLSVLGAGHAAGGAAAGGAAFNETSNNALLALPVLVEGVLAGGAMAARACLSSPTCLNALRMGGTTVVAKVAALLTPEDLMQIPGFGAGSQPNPSGPTTTPGTAIGTPGGNVQTYPAGSEPAGTGNSTGGNQIAPAAPGDNLLVNPATPSPAGNGLVYAVPPNDRNAINNGLSGTMGGMPVVTRPGSNEISEYPNGTQADADRVFDNLPLSDVHPIKSGYGDWGRSGTLPDGTTVTVRPSQDGRPTIEIVDRNRPGKGKTVAEIRFGSK